MRRAKKKGGGAGPAWLCSEVCFLTLLERVAQCLDRYFPPSLPFPPEKISPCLVPFPLSHFQNNSSFSLSLFPELVLPRILLFLPSILLFSSPEITFFLFLSLISVLYFSHSEPLLLTMPHAHFLYPQLHSPLI